MRREMLSMAEREEAEFLGVADALGELAWVLYGQVKGRDST